MKRRPKRTLKRVCVGVIYATLGAVLGSRFVRPHAPKAPAMGAAPAPVSAAEAALDRVIPEIDLQEVPFDEAVERARNLSGAPIVLDRRSLEARGIDPKTRVTFRARNAALQYVLGELGRAVSLPNCPVGCEPTDDVILVATGDALTAKCATVRVYDVRDLLAAASGDPGRNAPDPAIYQTTQQQGRTWTAEEQLIHLVDDTVADNSWRESGGVVGSIHDFAGRLVVTQTVRNHRQLARLLAQLRAPGEAAESPVPGNDLMLWDERLNRYVSVGFEEGESALRRRLAEVRLDAVPLDEAVSILAHDSHANLASNWQAVEAAGTDPHRRVTLHLRDATLADALGALFTAAGNQKLCFDPDGAYVRLTSRDDTRRPVRTRTYDMHDWVTAMIGPLPPGGAELARWQPSKLESGQLLVSCIRSAVERDSWKDGGGNVGVIQVLNDRLVVTQTWEAQRQVADLLAALRAEPARFRAALVTRHDSTTAPATAPTTGSAAPLPAGGGDGQSRGP